LGVFRGRIGLQRLAHLGARHAGQHQVEQNEVGTFFPSNFQSVLAIIGDEDLVPLLPKVVVEDLLDVRFILDHQNSRHLGLCRPSSTSKRVSLSGVSGAYDYSLHGTNMCHMGAATVSCAGWTPGSWAPCYMDRIPDAGRSRRRC